MLVAAEAVRLLHQRPQSGDLNTTQWTTSRTSAILAYTAVFEGRLSPSPRPWSCRPACCSAAARREDITSDASPTCSSDPSERTARDRVSCRGLGATPQTPFVVDAPCPQRRLLEWRTVFLTTAGAGSRSDVVLTPRSGRWPRPRRESRFDRLADVRGRPQFFKTRPSPGRGTPSSGPCGTRYACPSAQAVTGPAIPADRDLTTTAQMKAAVWRDTSSLFAILEDRPGFARLDISQALRDVPTTAVPPGRRGEGRRGSIR